MTCKYKDRYSGNGKHVHTAEVTHKYTGLWAPLRGCWQSFWHLIVSIRPMGHCYIGILLSLSERWDTVILTSHCLCQNDETLSFWHLTVSIRTMGLKQNVFCFCFCWEFHVRITFSYFCLHDLTNSVTEISEGGRQLIYDSMYKCGETVAHATFSPNIGWTSRFLLRNANKETQTSAKQRQLLSPYLTYCQNDLCV